MRNPSAPAPWPGFTCTCGFSGVLSCTQPWSTFWEPFCCPYWSPGLCSISSLSQRVIPLQDHPGPPQTLPRPLQVQLWLQLQMPLTKTSPQSLITWSHVGELCTPVLSGWERILSTADIGKLGPGQDPDKHLKCLVNWMQILQLVSFFFLKSTYKEVPRSGNGNPKGHQTHTRNILITGHVGRATGSSQPLFQWLYVLGVTACHVADLDSYTLRCVLRIVVRGSFLYQRTESYDYSTG